MNILLIEDNPVSGPLYVKMLVRNGYTRVKLVTTGLEGLQLARTTPFDAYLVDLDLPDLDGLHVGLALSRHIKYGRLPAAPIVAVTARADVITQNEAATLGFDAMVPKPCRESDLIAVLASLVGLGSEKEEA